MVIHWKLNEIMAAKRIRSIDLAAAIGISENSVYRLRRSDTMPRIQPKTLDGICRALNVQPGDLMKYVEEQGEDQ